MQSLSDDCAVYDSSGNLLKGEHFFEKYRGLVREISARGAALYFEARENRFLFGCLLHVLKGRGEKRVVFIQALEQIDSGIKETFEFYDKAVKEIEALEAGYKVTGLWDEGDISNIKSVKIPEKVLVYTAGKIISGEKVSIRASDVNIAINLIADTVSLLRLSLSSEFVFMASQYPSECDLSVSVNEPDPEVIFSPEPDDKIKTGRYAYYSFLYDAFVKSDKKFDSRESLASETLIACYKEGLRSSDQDYCNEIQSGFIRYAIDSKNSDLFQELQKPVKDSADFKLNSNKSIKDKDKTVLADFVRFVIEQEEKPANGTKILLEEIFTQMSATGVLLSLFTQEELTKIDSLMDTKYARQSLPVGEESRKKKNFVLIGALALAGLFLILIFGVSYSPFGSPELPDYQSPGADLSPEVLYPAANLSITPYSKVLSKDKDNNTICAPAPFDIKLKDTSKNAETITWDFGDGNTSQEKILHYTYLTPGTYNLTLYAENKNGTSSTYMYINVIGAVDSKNNTEIKENEKGGVEVSFKSSPTANSNKVIFEDRSKGTITKRYWDFGDGNNKTTTKTSVIHYYSDEKNVYSVSLTVTDENGTNFTKYQSIHTGW